MRAGLDPGRRRPRHFTTLAVLAAATLLLWLTGLHRVLWRPIAAVVGPWQAQQVAGNVEEVPRERELEERLMRLAASNAELRRRLAEFEELGRVDGFGPGLRHRRCRILSLNRERGRHYLEIDRGVADGIARDRPVVVGWSLVGIVAGEEVHRSLVQLVTDREFSIPVSVYAPVDGEAADPDAAEPDAEEAEETEGVEDAAAGDGEDAPPEDADEPGGDLSAGAGWVANAVAVGTGEPGHLELELVETGDQLELAAGFRVLTNGIGGRVPAGLVVGTLAEVQAPTVEGHWRARIVPMRPWGSYHSVLVPVPGASEGASSGSP